MKLKINKNQSIFCFALVITVLLSLFLIYELIKLNDLKDNCRYFFSATAQSFAALVSIVIVVFSIVSSQIPDYEPLFKERYRRILDKYHELKKIRKLIILSGIVILICLLSSFFVVNNLYLLFFLITVNITILILALIEFILFFSNSLVKSGKDKFFNDTAYLIINNFSNDDLFETYNNIREFRQNPNLEKYNHFSMDMLRISGLLRPLLYAFGRYLLDKKRMGEQSYYRNFKQFLDYVLQESNKEIIWQSVYYKISPYFKEHVNICIEDGHCQKYIPDVIGLVTKMIDGFIKGYNGHMRDEYLKVFKEIIMQINGLENCGWYQNVGLDEISISLGVGGLIEFPVFLNLLNDLGIPKNEKIKWLKNILDVNKTHYDKARDDEEYHKLLISEGVSTFGIGRLEDRKHYIKMLNDEILKLNTIEGKG